MRHVIGDQNHFAGLQLKLFQIWKLKAIRGQNKVSWLVNSHCDKITKPCSVSFGGSILFFVTGYSIMIFQNLYLDQ